MPRSPKNLFLNSRLQGQQIAYSIASYLFGCLSMGFAVFIAYMIFANRNSANADIQLNLNVINFFLSIGFPIVLSVCIGIGLVFVVPFSIVMSHRTAGPIVAIRRYIAALKNGEYNAPLTLRDGDELTEIAGELKALAENLKKQQNRVRTLDRVVEDEFTHTLTTSEELPKVS